MSIFITIVVSLLAAAVVTAIAGQGMLALLYVPANLVIPVAIAVILFHKLLTRFHVQRVVAIPLVALVYAAVVGIMFAVDIFFINPGTPAKVIFATDYRGWILPSVVVVIVAPVAYLYLGRKLKKP